MKRERGSIILEAALVFPIVLLVILAFSVLVRYFLVYETMQHGMYETTREMSAYYYLYSTTGLESFSNDINGTAQSAEENLDMLAAPINATVANIKNIAGTLSATRSQMGKVSTDGPSKENLSELRESVEQLANGVESTGQSLQDSAAAIELIAESPLETMTYVLQYAGGSAFQWGQNSLMNLIGQALLSKHIPGGDLQKYAEFYGISDLHDAMAWNAGGSGDVEMLLTYKFTIRLFGGIDFQVVQRTKAKGWGIGV